MKIVPCLERKYLVSNPHISFLLVSSYLLVMVDSRKVLTICRIIFRLSILGPSANASSTQFDEICLLMYIALNFRNVRPFSTSLYSPIFLFSFPALAGFSASCCPPPPLPTKTTTTTKHLLRFGRIPLTTQKAIISSNHLCANARLMFLANFVNVVALAILGHYKNQDCNQSYSLFSSRTLSPFLLPFSFSASK